MIRLGLLGCADIALRRLLPAIDRTPGVKVTAVASHDPARGASTAGKYGADATVNYQALLERPDIDAVYVPLPPALHAEWIGRALKAGKHVLAEKPLTTDVAHTADLVAHARGAGLVLMENYMFLHHGQHRRVRDLLAEGIIGEVRVLSAAFTIPPRPRGDIRYRPELGGGALFDVGGYPVRAAQLLLGPELEVAGATLRQDTERGIDVGGAALLTRWDGAAAQLSFGMEHFYTSSYDVLGSAGRIHLTHAFTPPADHAPVLRVETREGAEELILEPEDQCMGSVAAFVRAIRERAEPDEAIVGQAELIDAIRRGTGPQGRH